MIKHIVITLLLSLFVKDSFCQNQPVEYYIPIEIWYNPGYKWRIPWEVTLDNDNWLSMLNYPFVTNSATKNKLMQENKKKYDELAQKVLFPRKACDSLVRDYVDRCARVDDWQKFGKEGMYMEPHKSGRNHYNRCVCIPATELINIPHKQKIKMGHMYKYFEPKEFCAKFKRWKLDSLDLTEAPYFSIFPLDISPSFPCNKATTPIEKAICRDATLAKLDKKLASAYKEVLIIKGESIKTSQKEWILKRDQACDGKNNDEIINILIPLYQQRLIELKR